MLTELRAERDNLMEAISVLERLVYGRGKRRGRPPAWIAEVKRRDKPSAEKSPRKRKI